MFAHFSCYVDSENVVTVTSVLPTQWKAKMNRPCSEDETSKSSNKHWVLAMEYVVKTAKLLHGWNSCTVQMNQNHIPLLFQHI